MPKAVDFRRELQDCFRQAQDVGAPYVDVVAGDLHRAVGGYPSPEPRIPNCCSVMRQEFDPDNDEILSETMKDGARLAIRYKLPRSESRTSKRGFWSSEKERRQKNTNGTSAPRPAEQSTVYNIYGNAYIGDNLGSVTQTSTINVRAVCASIDELKCKLEWAGSERQEEIIKQLISIQEHVVGGRTAETKSAWQSVVQKIRAIAGVANSVWDLIGRISQMLT